MVRRLTECRRRADSGQMDAEAQYNIWLAFTSNDDASDARKNIIDV